MGHKEIDIWREVHVPKAGSLTLLNELKFHAVVTLKRRDDSNVATSVNYGVASSSSWSHSM